MSETWPDRGQLLEMAAGFRNACVLGAAAELELFDLLNDRCLSLDEIVVPLRSDRRATRILLDALAAIRVLKKADGRYSVPEPLRPLLQSQTPQTVLPMIQHNMAILRGWSGLAWTVKGGLPAPRVSSIRGPGADRAAFIAAMHTVSGPAADDVIRRFQPPPFKHLLDVGGASGTWTLALLRAATADARATIFDLPDAIQQARARIAQCELGDRIALAPGDFYRDELPSGVDFAWVSAIIHQHGRAENQALFAKVHRALVPGGTIGIRDFVMSADRTQPPQGALFAVNMLANTEWGDTFSFDEIAEDLQAAGFVEPQLRLAAQDMNAIVVARR